MLSENEKILIIKYHNDGMSNKEIATIIKVSVNTISKIINKHYSINKEKIVKLKNERKQKASNEIKKYILNLIEINNKYKMGDIRNNIFETKHISLSKSTIYRILKSFNLVYSTAIIKPFLTEKHKNIRLLWALNNINRNWPNIIFSDEASFWINNSTVRCWHKKGEREVIHHKRHSKKVHVWACISLGGVISFYTFTENLDSDMYKHILEMFLMPIYNNEYIFQQDNSPIHKSKVIRKFMDDKNIVTLNWPPYSPDLNPIENLWSIIKEKLSRVPNLEENNLEFFVNKIVNEIEYYNVYNIISNMHNRIQLVIDNNGDSIKY